MKTEVLHWNLTVVFRETESVKMFIRHLIELNRLFDFTHESGNDGRDYYEVTIECSWSENLGDVYRILENVEGL